MIAMMSPFLVNVSLAWYLLLLNFDLKDELADDLSASPSTVTCNYVRGKQPAPDPPDGLICSGKWRH